MSCRARLVQLFTVVLTTQDECMQLGETRLSVNFGTNAYILLSAWKQNEETYCMNAAGNDNKMVLPTGSFVRFIRHGLRARLCFA